VKYLIGTVVILNGIGYLARYTVVGGGLMIAAGGFLFPVVKRRIETTAGVSLSTSVQAGIFAISFMLASGIAITHVNLAKAPDFIPGI
jgi:hypothetical protein